MIESRNPTIAWSACVAVVAAALPAACGEQPGPRNTGSGGGLTHGIDVDTDSTGDDAAFGSTGADDSSPDPGEPKFDIAPSPDASVGACGAGDAGEPTVESYIWIANTADIPNTVSKIDTRTMAEVGRYQTRADGLGSPSRTSVALSGHAAVANRTGGVTKFLAYGCPGATSSGGPGSELPWAMESCRAWSVDMAYGSQRPIAWTAGTYDDETCTWEDEYLWVGGANGGNSGVVLLMDGADGTILETVAIPELPTGNFGPYGGAVDGDGNFWFSQVEGGTELVRVPFDNPQAYEFFTHNIDAYGMQVDYKGRPWLCGRDGNIARFTPGNPGWWDYAQPGGEMWGCMPDSGAMWVGGSVGTIRGIDLESMVVVHEFALPGIDNNDIHGTSVDFDGYVWAVSRGTTAARVDPSTGEVAIVGGLDGPYTYSDMTGFALSNVGNPEG